MYQVSIADSQPVHIEQFFFSPQETIPTVVFANVVFPHVIEFGHKVNLYMATRIKRQMKSNY